MHLIIITLSGLFATTLAAATPRRNTSPLPREAPPSLLAKRAPCGEGAQLVCYGQDGGTSQNLDEEDIEYAALYLRWIANNNNNPLWTMPPEFECSEWTLPLFGAGTVLALAKHINPRTHSSVTYTDLARTIDGGDGATAEQRAASLLGACGSNGGQLAIIADATDPAYNTPAYIESGARPADIIVKLVRDPAFP